MFKTLLNILSFAAPVSMLIFSICSTRADGNMERLAWECATVSAAVASILNLKLVKLYNK